MRCLMFCTQGLVYTCLWFFYCSCGKIVDHLYFTLLIPQRKKVERGPPFSIDRMAVGFTAPYAIGANHH